VCFTEIVVEEVDVAPGDLQRRRTVTQDALQAEYVAAVCQEPTRKRVAKHVRRAPQRQGALGYDTLDEVLESDNGQRPAALSTEDRRVQVVGTPAYD
jgi:hypothetical protein